MSNKNNYDEQHINDVNMGVDELFYPSKKKLLNNKKNTKIKIIGKRFGDSKKNKISKTVVKKTNISTTNSGLVKRKIEFEDDELQDKDLNLGNEEEIENEDKITDLEDEVIIGINHKKKKNDFEKKYDKFSQDNSKKNAQVREKKKKEKDRVRKIKSIIVLLVFIAMFIYFITSPIFNITIIEVNGNTILNDETYTSLSKIELNKNIYRMTKKQIKDNILENAYVEDVIINRALPNKIIINVNERTPKYMIEYMGSYMYIDENGNMLDLNTQKKDLPIILGASTQDIVVGNKLNETDMERINIVAKILEVAQSYQIVSQISKVDISNSENYTLYLENDTKVAYLGDGSNIITRILYLKAILEREIGIPGEIFINGNTNTDDVFFREKV